MIAAFADGLNAWQWHMMETVIAQNGLPGITSATLAWIPSITAWSRQALFRGARPDLATDNRNEENLFLEYWRNAGHAEYQIAYRKMDSHMKPPEPDVAILGMVCNDIDDMMQGNVLGLSQFVIDTRHWLEKSDWTGMIQNLKHSGFTVFITSDHGSIAARGIKNLKMSEKFGSLSRGRRHLQFANELFLKSFRQNNPDLDAGVMGLSLYLRDNSAFVTPDETIMTHGGSHFWKVLVPFAEI